jgi:hypothetical protein
MITSLSNREEKERQWKRQFLVFLGWQSHIPWEITRAFRVTFFSAMDCGTKYLRTECLHICSYCGLAVITAASWSLDRNKEVLRFPQLIINVLFTENK